MLQSPELRQWGGGEWEGGGGQEYGGGWGPLAWKHLSLVLELQRSQEVEEVRSETDGVREEGKEPTLF